MIPRAVFWMAGLALALTVSPAAAAAPRPFTFFVSSDSHFGAERMEAVNTTLIDHLNTLPGAPYPPEVGGQVETPRGLLVLGDLTDNGHLEEFAQFERLYGLTGRDGRLRYPVFEAIGNHDVNATSPIKERAKARHGGINYSWDWEGVHFACLDMYPDAATRAWMEADLRRLPRGKPVIVFFHYALEGRLSHGWSGEEKDAFAAALAPYNVLAIFHGHTHRDGFYQWRGLPVFRPGASRHSAHTFLVVRVGADEMTVAARDFDTGRWLWARSVPVRR